jgi:hypothetical protein
MTHVKFSNICFWDKEIEKNNVFENFTWVIIHLEFGGFPFKTSKLKNDIMFLRQRNWKK